MHKHSSRISAAALQLKPLAGRLMVVFLLSASVGLIAYGKIHDHALRGVRATIADTVMPVVSLLSRPGDALTHMTQWIGESANLRKDNEALRAENARLRQWQSAALELQSENDKLRRLLQFAPAGKSAYSTARIVADTGNPFSRSAIITSGSDQHVQEDQAVINDSGLVGRIVEVGKKTARVLLLSDLNSRIPVVSEHSRERAIAGGNGGELLSLYYLPAQSKIQVGETIITSGDGGVLPPGLPVGVVERIDKGVPVIKPFVDWYHLEYVSVVDFSM